MEKAGRGEKPTTAGAAAMFAGTVELDRLATPGALPGAAAVTFRDGARTHWHSHSGGQMLYVIEGDGRVGTADGVTDLRPGDLVTAPPGERHWHGAAEGADMTHLAVSFGEASWFEPVE